MIHLHPMTYLYGGVPGVKLFGGGSDLPECQNTSSGPESPLLRFRGEKVDRGGMLLNRGFNDDVEAKVARACLVGHSKVMESSEP